MHKIFGTKEDKEYKDRIGAYIIPVNGNEVGVVEIMELIRFQEQYYQSEIIM